MMNKSRGRVQLYFDPAVEPSLTKEAFKQDCDINAIMARYNRTRVLDHVKSYPGQYGDFSEVLDYREALDRIQDADDAFMSLPATLRTKFDNDPAQFLDFVDNPVNYDEMVSMGLANPRSESVQTPVSSDVSSSVEA